ncbi:MAG: hypothetical protein J6Y78_01255 [Paludibacteraceae bacterium]|nr:hypothetical protein [Paludibacteraceae bacterium]
MEKALGFKKQVVAIIALLSLPMLAFGQYQTDSLRWFNGETTYYLTLPNRLFVHTDSAVTQENLKSLIDKSIDSEYAVTLGNKGKDNRVIPDENSCDIAFDIDDDKLLDTIIAKLLKDDGVLVARRVYIRKSDYDIGVESDLIHPGQEKSDPLYGHYSYTYAQFCEWWFYDDIHCEPYDKVDLDKIPTDSICKALGLSFEYQEQSMYPCVFIASKGADILKISAELCETGYFKFAIPQCLSPFATYGGTTGMKTAGAAGQGKTYYDMSGRKKDSPSGLTIVVEQNSDGTVRTKKKLFK